MTTDTIKHLGAEFHHAADGVGEALQRLERARADRLAFLRRCSKDSTARLAALKEEVRALPEQIAKWDAEAARLESQTAEDLLRQALEPVREEKPTEERGPVFGPEDHERCHYCKGLFLKPVEYHHTEEECAFLTSQVELGAVVLHPQPPGEVTEAPLTQPKPDPFRAGLPPERLRKVWAEWENIVGDILMFTQDGQKFGSAQFLLADVPWAPVTELDPNERYRPHGATWARVEAMADEAEKPAEHVTVAAFDPSRHEGGPDGVLCLHFAWIPPEFFAHHTTWETPSGKQMGSADVLALAAREWRPVGTTWAEVKAKVMQPTVKPAEDEDPIEKAFWRYCMLIDKTQKTARVKAGYLEAPYPNRDAFKIAVRSTVLGLGVPATSFTPPAPTLLDLTKLPPGTVCEATADIVATRTTAAGVRFEILEPDDGSTGSWPAFVEICSGLRAGNQTWFPALVPARVVKEGGEQ